MSRAERPVGVFDSGVGGLTVLRALTAALPGEDFIYLGDTARLPYGTKSGETVVRYSLACAHALAARDVKALVVACNTASSVALGALACAFPALPVQGVLEPGAQAAVRAVHGGAVAVLATEGTIERGAYQRALERLRPGLVVHPIACPLFVALAEEGLADGPIVELVAARYLDPLRAIQPRADTLLLGCTHFPVLAPLLGRLAGPGVTLVDSAHAAAAATRALLGAQGLLRAPRADPGRVRFLATDGAGRFARVGGVFWGAPLAAAAVEVVDL